MSKQSAARKKPLIISGVIILILALGAAGYFIYTVYQHKQVADKKAFSTQAQQELAKTFISGKGDLDLATDYVVAYKQGNASAAAKIYQSRIESETSEPAKLKLYEEFYQTAVVQQQYQDAITASLGRAALKPDFTSFDMAANSYGLVKDTANQIMYLKKAYHSLDPNKAGDKEVMLIIQHRLNELGSGI